MLRVLSVSVIFFCFTALGYLLGILGIFSQDDTKSLNKFVFYFCLPIVCLDIFLSEKNNLINLPMLLAYFIAGCVICGSVFLLLKYYKLFGTNEALVLSLAAALPNHVLFVYPIAEYYFVEQSLTQLKSVIFFDTTVTLLLVLLLLQRSTGANQNYPQLIAQYLMNPPVFAMLLGIFLWLVGIEIPNPIHNFIDMAALLAAPLTLFSLGILISNTNIFRNLELSLILSCFKLILHPFLFFYGLASYSLLSSKPVFDIMSALGPAGASILVYAIHYKIDTANLVRFILVSFILSIFSITFAFSNT